MEALIPALRASDATVGRALVLCVALSLLAHVGVLLILTRGERSKNAPQAIVPVELSELSAREASGMQDDAKDSARQAHTAADKKPAASLDNSQGSSALGILWSDFCAAFDDKSRRALGLPDCLPNKRARAPGAGAAAAAAEGKKQLEDLALAQKRQRPAGSPPVFTPGVAVGNVPNVMGLMNGVPPAFDGIGASGLLYDDLKYRNALLKAQNELRKRGE